MATFDHSIDLPAPPDQVFALVAEARNAVRWHPAIVRADRADEAVTLGSVTDSVFTFYGREIELAFAVTELQEPRRVVFEAASRRARARDEFDIEAADGGSRLRYRSELHLGGFLRVFDRGLQVAFDGIGRRALDGLGRELA
ncbi:MAG: SRPBCC family protein [Acidimicrobiia bacterium]|nr:SRPBCC family protein [Acidimicrobiia bacterium]